MRGPRPWWLAVPAIAVLAGLGVYLSDQGATPVAAGVPIRPQSPREHFVLHGEGTPATAFKGQAEFNHAVYRVRSDSGLFAESGHAAHGARYDYWVLFTSKPTRAVLEPLARLPLDVDVRYGGTITVGLQTALASEALSLLGARLGVTAAESGFDEQADAVEVTYRPPDDVGDEVLTQEEQGVLRDIAEGQPDGMLPLPIRFLRDPGMEQSRGPVTPD